MNYEIPREMKIAADELAARDHLDDPAWDAHEMVATQTWRTLQALGHQGGRALAIGDNCATLLGLRRGSGPRHGSVIGNVDGQGRAHGELSDLNCWDQREDFDVVFAALAGFDVRLTYAPNIVKRRADQLVDATLAVAVTRPGSIAAVLATHDLMDNPMPFGRRQIAALADLVGAVRFPAGTYRRTTGTDEIADLLVFRRRESDTPRRGAEWEEATAVGLDGGMVFVNTYFDTNVDQVLGSTQYDATGTAPTNLTVVGDRTQVSGLLAEALDGVVAFARRTGLTIRPAEGEHRRVGRGTVGRAPAAHTTRLRPNGPQEPDLGLW